MRARKSRQSAQPGPAGSFIGPAGPFYPLKALPNTWTRQGFTYQVIARCGMVVLVERLPCGIGAVPHFEVAHLTVHPERFVLGRRIRGGEAYPSAEQWGEKGWTYQTLEAARAKFDQLTQTVKLRTNTGLHS